MIDPLVGACIYAGLGILVAFEYKKKGTREVERIGRMGPYTTTKNTFRAEGQTGAAALFELIAKAIIWPGLVVFRIIKPLLERFWSWLRTPYHRDDDE